MVSAIKLALGAGALIVAGAVARKYQAGTGLTALGTGITSLVSSPLIGTAKGFSGVIGTAQEGIGLFDEIGGALDRLGMSLGKLGKNDDDPNLDFPPSNDKPKCLPASIPVHSAPASIAHSRK